MEDLFLAEIEDLYDCEKRLTKALPKMAKASTSLQLRQAFESHLQETQGHVERLERVFSEMGKQPKAETCQAIKGLIEEGEEMISNTDQSPVRDAGIIAAANRVEHYEMAALWIGPDVRADPRTKLGGFASGADPGRGENGR